tara:strand:- start:141 stop:431 length:291 start_codon:yes stop_codon:yes gene_type:complete
VHGHSNTPINALVKVQATLPGFRVERGMSGWIDQGDLRVVVTEVDADDCAACADEHGVTHYVHYTPGKGWLDGSGHPFIPDLHDRATRLLLNPGNL